MQLKFKAGEFEIESNGLYPFWCAVTYKGESISTIRHDELHDLEYIVGRMRHAIRGALPLESKHEVD